MSVYAQDSFKLSSQTSPSTSAFAGSRPSPIPTNTCRGTSFTVADFLAGVDSTVHPTAPAGLFFPGDPGIPAANWNGHIGQFRARASAWSGIPTATASDTFRMGGCDPLRCPSETWFNERETTNPPVRQRYRRRTNRHGGFSNPWAGLSGRKSVPAKRQSLLPAHRRNVHQHADQSQADLRSQLERHLSAPDPLLAGFHQLPRQQDHAPVERGGETNPAVYIPWQLCRRPVRPDCCGPCSTTTNTNSAPHPLPGESGHGRGLRQHQHRGRRRRGPLSGPVGLRAASLRAQLPVQRQLHRFLLPFGLRFRRRAGRCHQFAALQSPRRLGPVRLRHSLQLQQPRWSQTAL